MGAVGQWGSGAVGSLAAFAPLASGHLEAREENKYKHITILQDVVQLQITTFSDVINIIIPFFDKYPVLGQKALDFLEFKNVSRLMLNRKHLTVEGFQQIIKIKEGMNLRRKW